MAFKQLIIPKSKRFESETKTEDHVRSKNDKEIFYNDFSFYLLVK